MIIIVLCVLLAAAVGKYSENKGYSFIFFLLISIFLTPVIGFLWVYLKKDISVENDIKKGIIKKCPYCAEIINDEAIICKYCGKDQDKKIVKLDDNFAEWCKKEKINNDCFFKTEEHIKKITRKEIETELKEEILNDRIK